MEKREFIKKIAASTALLAFNPLSVLKISKNDRKVVLPFIDGEKEVILLGYRHFNQNEVMAQYGWDYLNYGINYNYLAAYQTFYAYQQALNNWQQMYNQWMAQQYYAWLNSYYWQAMQNALNFYRNYQVTPPTPWNSIKSIYAFAKDYQNKDTFFGINKQYNQVAISETLLGADKVYQKVSNTYGLEEAQKTVGPQSSERNSAITLPDNSILYGKGYDTVNGTVSVSNKDQLVRSNDGKTRRLVKYVTGPDGVRYELM